MANIEKEQKLYENTEVRINYLFPIRVHFLITAILLLYA